LVRNEFDQPLITASVDGVRDRILITGTSRSPKASASGSLKERAWVDHSANARTAEPPAGFGQSLLDPRPPVRNSPSVRAAVHANGTLYVAYFTWRQALPSAIADVVVARDDAFRTGTAPFTALARVRVAKSVPIPWRMLLGQQQVGSALSIAVNPANSSIVYIAWGDGPGGGSTQTLRVRRSRDGGATWSDDLVNVTNATNPALAMTDDARVGFFYQQFVERSDQLGRWETHVQITSNDWASKDDVVLAKTLDDPEIHSDPYMGDYADLEAIKGEFYGAFSAHNLPDADNFPSKVRFQRNCDFNSKRLLDLANKEVPPSIDPFFFHIS